MVAARRIPRISGEVYEPPRIPYLSGWCGAGEDLGSFVFPDVAAALVAHRSSGPRQEVIVIVGEDAARATPPTSSVVNVREADHKPDGRLRQDNVVRRVVATKPSRRGLAMISPESNNVAVTFN